jgi:hypothetical protein
MAEPSSLATRPSARLRGVLALVAVTACCLVWVALLARNTPLIDRTFPLQTADLKTYTPAGAHGFIAPLPDCGASDATGESSVKLFENGKPLGPGRSQHATILEQGGGAYSHWHNVLYLSTSDNSNPAANGRHYTIQFQSPPQKPQALVRWSLVLGCLGLAIVWLHRGWGQPLVATWCLPALLAATGLLAVAVLVVLPPISPGTLFDVSQGAKVSHHQGPLYLAQFTERLPLDAVLRENGRPLPMPDTIDVEKGMGRYQVAADRLSLLFSSTDDTNPLENGRHYEIARRYSYVPAADTMWELLGVCLAMGWLTVLARFFQRETVTGWKSVAHVILASVFAVTGPSPRWQRRLVLALLVMGFVCAFQPRWNVVRVVPDSWNYITNAASRPPLYPTWLDLFCSDVPSVEVDNIFIRGQDFEDAQMPFLSAIRGQKVMFVVAVSVIFLALATRCNAWLLLALIYAYARYEAAWHREGWGDLTQCQWLDYIMSEGINGSLILLLVAATFRYLMRPGPWLALGIGCLLTALALNRTANLPLLLVLGAVAMRHVWFDGWRCAVLRTSLAGGIVAAAIGGISLHNYLQWGQFKYQCYTGFNAIGIALQLLEPGDVSAFDDPQTQEFLRRCLAYSHLRLDYKNQNYFNTNAHLIAGRVLREMASKTAFENIEEYHWQSDALLVPVAKKLIWLHPAKYAEIVAYQVSLVWNAYRHIPLIVVGLLAIVGFFWTRGPEWLFMALWCAVPFAMWLPACLVEAPLIRYQSQTYFMEFTLPALAVMLAVSSMARALALRAGQPTASSSLETSAEANLAYAA